MNQNKTKNRLVISPALLELAEISPDANLEISYEDGRIVISETDILDFVPAELLDLFDELGICEDSVREVLAEDNGILEALMARET